MRRALLGLLIGCGPHQDAPFDASARDGDVSGTDEQTCGALTVSLRDFRADHPDFEHGKGAETGLVASDLGADGKPMFAHTGASVTVTGPASFEQWYRDVSGVNLRVEQSLPLTELAPGTFVFDDQTFFPLDGMGWPNTEIYGHNFLFTSEIHTTFRYRGGERFMFDGDDDLFVFVNRKLALDLGGVHAAESGTIDFDASAAALGLQVGQIYPLDVFHAERHTDQSHFRMETTIDCFIIE